MGEKKRRLAAAASITAQISAARRLHEAGQLKEAQAAYSRVLAVDPTRAKGWFGMGLLARDSGARDAAVKLFAKAVALAPADAEMRMNYAWSLQDREDFDAACIQWRAACGLRPHEAAWWESLGVVEQAAGNTANAVAAYRRAIAIEPTAARRMKIATAISPIPASREAIAAERARMAAVLDEVLAEHVRPDSGASQLVAADDPFDARPWTNFYLAYHGENDRDLQIRTAAVYRRLFPSLNYVAAHCGHMTQPAGRIRIGLISQFFRDHSIGRTSRGLFAQLSRERFEVTAIFISPVVDDEFAQAIRRDAEHSLVVPRDLRQAREQIAALKLDVLFYQDIGMEPFAYFLSFARLAPVQCVSFGHPDTTGVSTIDYFVSNDLYEPPDAALHYSEKVYLLRNLGSLAYYYRPVLRSTRKPRAAFGLPVDRPVYLCPQNLFKVHPDMDDLIAGILRRDRRGVVAMVQGKAANWTRLLRQRWQATMPDLHSRIVFVPRMPDYDYLNLIALADVMLDTVHFNGMNTSLEAFAVGTPVVTLPAKFQRGRHTQAMYRRMGLDDLIAHDARTYIDRAVRLANDRDYRAAASRRILEKNGALFEDAEVVREFERFFLEVVRKRSAHRKPL